MSSLVGVALHSPPRAVGIVPVAGDHRRGGGSFVGETGRAVVAREDDQGVFGEAAAIERVEHAADRIIKLRDEVALVAVPGQTAERP